jgi:quinol monooxygenase YgiN
VLRQNQRHERAVIVIPVDRIRVIATFPNIPEGNIAEFKRVAAQALELAKDEAGVLEYDWFLNGDETACVVHEAYEDSAALLTHIANLGAAGITFEPGGDLGFEVFGPTPELREATAGLQWVFTYFQGM